MFTLTVDNGVHDYIIKPFQANSISTKIKIYGDLLKAENALQNTKLKAAFFSKDTING